MKIDWAYWCHAALGPKWDIDTFIRNAKSARAVGIELAPPEHWPKLKAAGLTCPVAILDYGESGPAPFEIGWNDPAHHHRVTTETLRQIELCKSSDGVCSSVIAFSGNRVRGMTQPEAIGNCVNGLRQLMPKAEAAGVRILFEFLNDLPAEGWRGHAGFDCTTLEYALDVINGVGSRYLQVLFDVYHRQRKQGNVIQGLLQAKDCTGHIHVAGIGEFVRGELNVGRQDLNYHDIFAYLRDTGYDKGIGIEYIPTEGRHYLRDLKTAMKMIRGK